ncbi:hypothetical protein [Sporosarcina sp. JAI121]|uniref:hypothetical protein n=1 Tax=Sporosarcina sp. JAI121 TaxID=2723064 RepID=UPI0015CB4F87|nr:hypothetical protein [Sporosarcina sp. JAI121]NYF23660.1 hypothetical protein [Sporosarcina sp. JAI121]
MYLRSEDLKGLFQTEGAFYELIVSGRLHICRSVAKISRRGVATTVADALFVLVNPGSCAPSDDTEVLTTNPESIADLPFVQAKSDETQRQVMRLMDRMKWNMTYIINLSDLRVGNIEGFRHVLHYMDVNEYDAHSIFTPHRLGEIDRLLSPDTKIIAGWGVSPLIKQRAFEALTVLTEKGTLNGHRHETEPFYYHPYQYGKTKSKAWVDAVAEELGEGVYQR